MVLKLERGRAALAPFPTWKYSDLEAESMMSELGKNLAQKTRSWRFVSQRKFRSHRPTALHSGPQIPVVRKTFALPGSRCAQPRRCASAILFSTVLSVVPALQCRCPFPADLP